MIDTAELNRTEQWIAEHSIRLFITVAVLMVIGALFTLKLLLEQNETQSQVDVLRPKVTRVVHAASVCNAKALKHKGASETCAERLRIALVNCRRHSRCRAAFLATLSSPPPARKGVVSPDPSTTGSQPAPPSGGVHKEGAKRPPKTSKPPPRAESAVPPAGDTPPAQPGNAPDTGGGVKACVNLAVSACVKADATP